MKVILIEVVKGLSEDGQKSWWILMHLGDFWRDSVGSVKCFSFCFIK